MKTKSKPISKRQRKARTIAELQIAFMELDNQVAMQSAAFETLLNALRDLRGEIAYRVRSQQTANSN